MDRSYKAVLIGTIKFKQRPHLNPKALKHEFSFHKGAISQYNRASVKPLRFTNAPQIKQPVTMNCILLYSPRLSSFFMSNKLYLMNHTQLLNIYI